MKYFIKIITIIIIIINILLICNFNITTYAVEETTKDTASVKINNKTFSNGIYKIAVGKDSNKTVEIAGSTKEDNGKVDIWNYRKCTSSKVLF